MPKAVAYVPHVGPIVTRAEAKAAGLKRYFTGEPCKHGHISQRQTTNNKCWGCKTPNTKAYMDAWLAKNPDRRKAHTKAYWARHRKHYQDYYQQNIDRIRTRNAAWRKDNPEAYRRLVAEWQKANPDRVKRNHRNWVLKNPEKLAVEARKRRSRKQAAEGTHTAADILALLERQAGKCVYCFKSIRSKYHADHIVPLVKGGSNWIGNIQLTCPTCNMRKNRSDPIAFANRMGRLL